MGKTTQKIINTGLALMMVGNLAVAKPNKQVVEDKKQQEETIEVEKAPLVEPGFNALEAAVTSEIAARTRLQTNLKFNLVDPINIGVSGMNETTNLSKDNYFGINTIFAGKRGGKIGPAAIITADSQGLFDVKYGGRYQSEMPGGELWITAGIKPDGKAGNITTYLGKDLGKGFFGEVYQNTELTKGDKPFHYTEIQLNKEVAKKFNVFVRAELEKFNLKEGRYLVGIAKVF